MAWWRRITQWPAIYCNKSRCAGQGSPPNSLHQFIRACLVALNQQQTFTARPPALCCLCLLSLPTTGETCDARQTNKHQASSGVIWAFKRCHVADSLPSPRGPRDCSVRHPPSSTMRLSKAALCFRKCNGPRLDRFLAYNHNACKRRGETSLRHAL